MSGTALRRVIYTSKACAGAGFADLPSILTQSRTNNGLDGLSGLLWTDGDRYVQLLEGPPESVDLTLARIFSDARHDGIRLVSDSREESRAFGDWTMANLLGDNSSVGPERLEVALGDAPEKVRAALLALISHAQG